MSHKLDLTETLANTVGGFVIAYLVSWLVFPLVGVETTAATAGYITLIMFFVSTIRLYLFRRMFRWIEGMLGSRPIRRVKS